MVEKVRIRVWENWVVVRYKEREMAIVDVERVKKESPEFLQLLSLSWAGSNF